MKRTGYCGAFREEDIGRSVTVMGWAQNKRDMGGVLFIDLRDREGTLQVVCDARKLSEKDFAAAEGLRLESVLSISGKLRRRDEDTINPKISTGTIELAAEELEVLSSAQPLPFALESAEGVREDLRLRYRFLDLRRHRLYENLHFRAKVARIVSEYLESEGFLAVETPMLCKSTPEGARDYLVPSRVHQGEFYALPQSPQIFKQLLMVGGIDRYYQVARCFRDEDLRADRQPEFTQVDMEMSFVTQEDILEHLEKMFKHLFKEALGITFDGPLPRITWQEAMDRYGSDKPDLRFGMPIVDLSDKMQDCRFTVFRKAVEQGGMVRAINAKGCANFSRTVIDELTQKAIGYGAKGMAWIAIREDGSINSILPKYFSEEQFQDLLKTMDAENGDLILFCADRFSTVCRALGGLRLDVADILGLRRKDDFKLLFVTDFPQFEYSEEEKRFVATHHPFTMPYPEDLQYLFTDPGRVRAQAYDVVLNGIELGSGSIRIHRQDIQQQMFEALGFSDPEIEDRFGFMVNAFRYGTPPHGGFAFGLDRLVMQMLGAASLRDVIAFPKNKDACCPMTGAPASVDRQQLEILGLFDRPEAAGEAKKGKESSSGPDAANAARLARLSLPEERKESMAQELSAIVSFANQLGAADTGNVEGSAYVESLKNVYREDRIVSSFPRDTLLKNAPEKRDGCFFVPQVVE